MIQLGSVPNRIDLLTGISGVATGGPLKREYQLSSWGSRVILSKDLLIQNKRAVGRPQDLADLAELERADS